MTTSRIALLLAAVVASTAVAAASDATHVAVPVLPMSREWVAGPTAHPDALHRVTFHMRHSAATLKALDAKFWSLVDPASPTYGQWLTQDGITRLLNVDERALKTVTKFLQAGGASTIDVSANRDAVSATMTVRAATAMFGVKFQAFTRVSAKGGFEQLRIRAARAVGRHPDSVHADDHVPRLPAEVADVVELVQGLTDLPPALKRTGGVTKGDANSVGGDVRTSDSRSKSTLAPGQQNITIVQARGGSVFTVRFNAMCMGGQATSSASTPCSDHPPALASVRINATALSDGAMDTVSKVVVPMCDDSTGTVVCSALIDLDYYRMYNVSVEGVFGSEDVGPAAYFVKGVVATPPVTPLVLDELYNIPPGLVVTNASATQAVVEFEQQYYSPSDLDAMLSAFGRPTPSNITVIGPNYASDPGGEANLDIQWMLAVAPTSLPITTFWSIKAKSSVEIDDILSWALAMSNTTDPPSVNSLSYGMTEGAVDKYQGAGYLARSDVEFQKLAMRGITIIIACGDTGAGDLGAPPMSNPSCETLHPDWPSQSPYVVAVGSTYVTPNVQPACYAGGAPGVPGGIDCLENPLGEVVVGLDQGLFWTTGGGFSNIAPMPDYQKAVVEAYLEDKTAIPPAGMFNASGRAYSDTSTVGHNLMTVLNGTMIPIDGTSASAPIFAGIVTLLNDARLNAGMPTLGFITPALYSIAAKHPGAFNDVVHGSNACGAYGQPGVPLCCSSGFEARPGWDAASGLGSPNFEVLVEEVMKL